MTSAADALLRAAALVRPQDEALATWIEQAGRRLRAGLAPDRALGMDKRTQARIRLAERNELLRSAYSMVPGEGPWSRALSLARECERFETAVLPHWRTQGGPPQGASRLRTMLWEARRLGRLPGPRMLAEICRQC